MFDLQYQGDYGNDEELDVMDGMSIIKECFEEDGYCVYDYELMEE